MESLRFGCARSWVRFPLFPFVFFAFFGLSALYPTGSDQNPAQRAQLASGVRTRTTGVVVVGVGAGLASPQRSGDARPTSDGGLASPQPSRNRHMLRDDGASGRRRARLFSIAYSDDTDFFEPALPALASRERWGAWSSGMIHP